MCYNRVGTDIDKMKSTGEKPRENSPAPSALDTREQPAPPQQPGANSPHLTAYISKSVHLEVITGREGYPLSFAYRVYHTTPRLADFIRLCGADMYLFYMYTTSWSTYERGRT